MLPMLNKNAAIFVAAQVGSRFANSFLSTAVRFEMLEQSGVASFASAQVANQLARVFMQQVSGVLTDNLPLKKLYVYGEAANLMLVLVLVPSLMLRVASTVGSEGSTTGAPLALFLVNIGLGLTQAFSQPVSKSLPPAVAAPDDLAVLNSWDLTGDKIARNVAPMAFTIVSSTLGFSAAVAISLIMYIVLVLLKQTLVVADRKLEWKPKEEGAGSLLTVFRQVWNGLKLLKSDRTIGLLIVNTLITNMLIYPLSSVVFPVIFKAIPDDALAREASWTSGFILKLQGAFGIQKKKAWMNYSALVSMGAAVGPFLSGALVYRIKAWSAKQPEEVNWVGLNFGIGGQILTAWPLLLVLHLAEGLSAGSRIFIMFVIWGAMNAVNNITTIYFNAHTQQRLDRTERGRFIANILTLFSMANSIGSLIYGWALSSGSAHSQIATSVAIAALAVVARCVLLFALRRDEEGKESIMIKRHS
eukprot:TRINITY_DN25790_c0_g1_i1.p1 TRINITY_DN25790_c0_g1~~TRINITY_DN25790_c0_g1_i1.p1  ORF type:complete len:473 (-),score=82.73 TRINITY_DN25790_c0_g1_i1:35-1453(-)